MGRKGMIAAVLLIAVLLVMPPVEAKTYYTTPSGHAAVRYNHNEIAPSLQPFVDYVEYDLVCAPGVGARLYFTSYGRTAIALYLSLAESIAYNVRAAPEWTGDRSLRSVKYEIYQHAVWPNRMIVHIEYYYKDMQWWELPYKNY
jgi:hypothetical protein